MGLIVAAVVAAAVLVRRAYRRRSARITAVRANPFIANRYRRARWGSRTPS